MPIPCKSAKRIGLFALLSSLQFSAAAVHAQNSLPQLWPTFTQPSTIINVGLSGQSGDDFMATTSFQGAYNQKQLSSRLYVAAAGDANYWLSHAIPSGVTVSNLSYNSGDPDGTLKALLSTYGPQGTNTVSKYVICDPVGAPETCNMATTLAGINDAMVVNPDNLTLMSTYGMTLVTNGDLRSYFWIGSNQDLIGNGSTYGTTNMISNPSGGNGTTGWTDNGGTLTTGTGSGSCAGQGTTLEWTRTSGTGDQWAWYDPAIPAGRITNSPITPYIFSVQVCVASGSPVFLDVWNGAQDIKSGTVAAGAGWQTLQLSVPLVNPAPSGNTTIKLQVRTSGSSTQVFFHNAATVDNRVAVDYYQYKNLFSSANQTILAQDFPGSANLRDYLIAAKIFTFELTEDGAYTDEQKLYGLILGKTGVVTPVLGYIDHEAEDVQYMSASYGKFLNATDDYNNGSVWASMPQPSSLSQPLPTAFKTNNGTLYLAFASSDGDNVSVDEHQNVTRRTASNYFGAVPAGWTTSPSMMQFAPSLLSDYYAFLPQSSEMIAGPSGFGYTRNISGSNQTSFASDTASFMNALNMSTTEYWTFSNTSSDQSNTYSFASSLGKPHVMWGACLNASPYCKQFSTQGTTKVDDQFSQYNGSPDFEVAAIENCLASSTCNQYSSSVPNYLEVLMDDFTLSPDDYLYVAQQLSLHESYPIVLMTPSMLSAAEAGGGSATTSPQAVLGTTLTSAFPQNLLFNAQGQSGNYGLNTGPWAYNSGCTTAFMQNTILNGVGATSLYVPANASCYAWEYLQNGPGGRVSNAGTFQVGRYYRFTASVYGASGVTAELTVYDGSTNNHATLAMNGTWQTISMIVKINSTTAGQIQIGTTTSTSAQTLYFNIGTGQPFGWYYSNPSTQTEAEVTGGTTYNNGSFGAQAVYFSVPASQSNSQWIAAFPDDTPVGATTYTPALAANTSYTATVDVAGTAGQQAYLDLWNGTADATSSTATLGQQWQTLSTTFTTGSSATPVQFEVRIPSGNSAAETVYWRNASLVPTSSIPSYLFFAPSTNSSNSGSPGFGMSSGPSQSSFANLGTTPSAQTFGGAGIIGVSPSSSGSSIMAYKKKDRYNEWEFTYDPMTDLALMRDNSVVNQPSVGSLVGNGSGPDGTGPVASPNSSSQE